MTSSNHSARHAQPEVRRHPIRGAIWGCLLGVGVAIYLVLFAVIAFGDWIPFALCVVAGIGLGVLWASFGPAKQPKGQPPANPVSDDQPSIDDQRATTSDDDAANHAKPPTEGLPPPTAP